MIYPKCKYKETQVPAIRYDGYVVPCCHMGNWNDINILRERMGDLVEQMHITNGTLDEINVSEAYQYIEDSFTNNPFAVCIRKCSNPIDLEENRTNANSDYTIVELNEK